LAEKFQYKISIIVVNYNVEFFLEQCLNSVREALKDVSGEVLVVDNNSIDNSVSMVAEKFPEFTLIANKDNLGFSKANNQGMKIAKGEYILLLNPDTVVQEDTFSKVLHFMDEHPDAGGLGVKMVDGKGRFLPESKRGLPTPAVAFWKLFGFSTLFPKSKFFGQYHLGYLDKNENHKIQILSGAFMLMRQEALNKVGLLDEAFFMYGEDIDLSYRLTQGGFNNYYFADTSIIHYKGESTKKSSVNYVIVFYRAMVIFAEKHFSSNNAKLFSFLINMAIYLRAGAAILSRFIKKITPPLLDSVIVFGGMVALTNHWASAGVKFPDQIFYTSLPSYALIWISMMYLHGTYDRPFQWINPLKGIGIGLLIILVGYALLPKSFQFSRLYIFTCGGWLLSYFSISRTFLHFFASKLFTFKSQENAIFAIIGDQDESTRVLDILKQTVGKIDECFIISPDEDKEGEQIGHINQLDQLAYIKKLDEIIFCAKNCAAGDIIHWMKKLEGSNIDFKIAQPDAVFLIGSNSIDTAGDLYLMHVNKIEDPTKQRMKRIVDLCISLIFIVFSVIFVWFYENKRSWFRNMMWIAIGKYSLVGYCDSSQINHKMLPKLKYGVLKANDNSSELKAEQAEKLNLIYARDYSISKDIVILKNCWRKLDRTLND
jgi:GT2 family glycosyltransferase